MVPLTLGNPHMQMRALRCGCLGGALGLWGLQFGAPLLGRPERYSHREGESLVALWV